MAPLAISKSPLNGGEEEGSSYWMLDDCIFASGSSLMSIWMVFCNR